MNPSQEQCLRSIALSSNSDTTKSNKCDELPKPAFQGPAVAYGPGHLASFKASLLKPIVTEQDKPKSRQTVLSYWHPRDTPHPLITRGSIVCTCLETLRSSSFPSTPVCFKCADKGYTVIDCRNVVLCFICNQLGHRARHCHAVTNNLPSLRKHRPPVHSLQRASQA